MPKVKSMGWTAFAAKMGEVARCMTDGDLPMEIVLQDGSRLTFDDVTVATACDDDGNLSYRIFLEGGEVSK